MAILRFDDRRQKEREQALAAWCLMDGDTREGFLWYLWDQLDDASRAKVLDIMRETIEEKNPGLLADANDDSDDA